MTDTPTTDTAPEPLAHRSFYRAIRDAVEAHQAAVRTLPHPKRIEPEWYGETPMYDRCPQSGEPISKQGSYRSNRDRVTCLGCNFRYPVPADERNPLLPEHARPLYLRDAAAEIVSAIAALLGMDRWENDVATASHAARTSRASTRDGMVASGLSVLTDVLVRRESQAAMRPAVTALTAARGVDGEPIFTETRLYDALGKDDARTVLALLRDVSHLAGGA